MNKKIFKILCLLLLIIISTKNVASLSLPVEKNETTGYSLVIEDDANLMSEDELDKLRADMQPLTEYGNIIFKSISENYTSTSAYASNFYHERFSTASGTLFLIDMDNRYIYIFSDGSNYKSLTTDKANIITDNAYKYASDARYYECASLAFSQINTILNGGKIAEPMRHASNIFIALTLAFFINFFIVLASTTIKKASAKEVLNTALIDFTVGDIIINQTGQRREFSPLSDSSGGSSGGGGGGGGGHSSGGGGGHRF